jgi:hypothetical protein
LEISGATKKCYPRKALLQFLGQQGPNIGKNKGCVTLGPCHLHLKVSIEGKTRIMETLIFLHAEINIFKTIFYKKPESFKIL